MSFTVTEVLGFVHGLSDSPLVSAVLLLVGGVVAVVRFYLCAFHLDC